MPKPSEGHLEWTDGDAAKIQDPGSSKKLLGWVASERPPFKFFNWLFYVQDLWNKYFEGITDTFIAQGLNYDAVVGPSGTHADINTLMLDAGIAAIKRVLVVDPLTVTANQTIDQDDMEFIFKPQAVITKGAGATIGLVLDAERITIRGGRIKDFSTGGDIGLQITANGRNCFIDGTRMTNNDSDFDESASPGGNEVNIISEV